MSGRTLAQRALLLTEPLYAAAVDPSGWSAFLEALAQELGDAAIAMSLMFPGFDMPSEYYRIHLREDYAPAFERHLRQGLPWPITHPKFRAGFAHGREIFPDEKVAGTGYYREYLKPQGLAPEGPMAHLIASSHGLPVCGIAIQRREGGRAFTDDDLALCNLLVPHLATATSIRKRRERQGHRQHARTHILDRMRVGVVVLDLTQRAIVTNRAAQAIFESGDGLFERGGIVHAARPRDEHELQRLVRAAIHYDGGEGVLASLPGGPSEGSFLAISRPSGKPSYALVVMRVFASPRLTSLGDEVAAIFITDPAPDHSPHGEVFRDLFGLTEAESQVVSLLAAGHPLEEISRIRGVKLGTTRTLLKRVYAKTRANRQGEVVRLVLAADSTLEDPDPGE